MEKLAKLKTIEIIGYDPKYAKDFYELNIEWLDRYFYVEELDTEVLSHPDKYIIEPGGYIFFAKEGDRILGTVALMPYSEGIFELTKMAVLPNQRGKKIGAAVNAILYRFSAKNKNSINSSSTLTLSSKMLFILYRKYGFIELELEPDSPYVRSNIKMELALGSENHE